MRPVRVSVKALIVRDGCILLQENDTHIGPMHCAPGGGQHPGESLHEALQRECLEEIGTRVEIGDIRFVRDYIASRHEFARDDTDLHQVEIYFECHVPEDYVPIAGSMPDNHQIGIHWVAISDLRSRKFFPQNMIEHLQNGRSKELIYLGEVN